MKNRSGFFIAGSYFASELEKELSKNLEKKGELYFYPKQNESVDVYIDDMARRLDCILHACEAEYFVLEIQGLLASFDKGISSNKCMIDKAFNQLINVIRNIFSKGKVLVIQTNIPKYYIMSNDLIKEMPKDLQKRAGISAINEYEKYIADKLDAILLNTTDFYFYKKRRGYLLNEYRYEEECYIDISKKIAKYSQCEEKIAKFPNPGCSIDRYVKYSSKTIIWNALDVFLNEKKIIDELILASPVDFVEKHKIKLLKARKIKQDTFEKMKRNIIDTFDSDEEFRNILLAFIACKNNIFSSNDISYKEMFRNSIVGKSVLKVVQKYVTEKRIIEPKRINNHNCGYYFALMNGENALEAKKYVDGDVVIEPQLLDVFGSCISRTCLRERYSGNTSLSANNYWFQVPAFVPTQKPVRYDKSVFEGLSGVNTQNVFLQLENELLNDISSSKAEWLLIDLFGLVQPHIYSHAGFIYSDMDGVIAKRLNSEKVDVLHCERLGDVDNILKMTDLWIETVKKKYNNKIILLEVNHSYLSKGDDNIIYAPRNKKKSKAHNDFYKKAFEYVRNKLDCYTIEITHEFCPDDCGFARRISVHYSYDFYRQASKIIEYIVYNEPVKKKYENIEFDVRISRMADMLDQNNSKIVKKIFGRSLDSIVMTLPVDMIRENIKTIVMWYEQDFSSVDDIVAGWISEWSDELKSELLRNTNSVDLYDETLLNDYPKEPFLGKVQDYTDIIPYAPQLYYKEEIKDTISKVNKICTDDALVFVNVTDIHYKCVKATNYKPYEVTFERMILNMREVLKGIRCDFVLNLGDDTDGDFDKVGDLLEATNYVQKNLLRLGKKYYRAIGNHDTNCYGKLIDVHTMNKAYLSHMSLYEDVKYNPKSEGTEFYKDFDEIGVRMVVLNTQYGEVYKYSESTGDWLSKDALKTDKLILLCEHLSCIHTMNMNAKPITNRESVIKALKNHKGTIVQLCGHSHCDYAFTDGDEKYSPWLTVFSNLQRCSRRRQSDIGKITKGNSGEFVSPKRKEQTVTEDCWDIVVLRPKLGKINFVRFGAGEDREFSFTPQV